MARSIDPMEYATQIGLYIEKVENIQGYTLRPTLGNSSQLDL